MKDVRQEGDADPDLPLADAGAPQSPKRKPYQSPELVEYGSVAKLTQGTLSMNSDFFGGGFRMRAMCL
jgi:hypothetical protein